MKNLGTSLRRGVKIMKNIIIYCLMKSNEKPRNITAARCNINNLCLTLYYLRILVENCPSLTTGDRQQINNYSNFQLIYSKPSKSGGSPGQLPPVEHPKMGLGPPNTCSKMAIRRLTQQDRFLPRSSKLCKDRNNPKYLGYISELFS